MSDGAEVEGADAVELLLRELTERVSDMRPVWPGVGDVVASEVRKQFDREGQHFGKAWEPLSPDYVRWKVDSGYDPQILVSTGRLRDSLTSRPMAVEEYGRREARFGTDVEYAQFHQFGTESIPRREMIDSDAISGRATEVLRRYVFEGRVR